MLTLLPRAEPPALALGASRGAAATPLPFFLPPAPPAAAGFALGAAAALGFAAVLGFAAFAVALASVRRIFISSSRLMSTCSSVDAMM